MGKGPLSGVKIIEMAGIGPGPFCAMLLSIWVPILSASIAKVGQAAILLTQIAEAASRLR